MYMRSTCIINHTHNKIVCMRANVHIHASVSRDSSIKKDAIHIHATSTITDTHLILQRINDIYRGYAFLRFLVRSG